jgi:Mu-like prophage I protein
LGVGVQTLVTASFTSAIPKNAPGKILYIPLGSSRINAMVSGKPGEITVNVPAERGTAIAAALQEALTKRLQSTVRPRLAFDHAKTGPASGHPSSFSFDPARGIVLAASWSNSGRAAIEGGDYGYFSPTFLIDADGTPSGLPDKGEIGSLVDEPAFRAIGLIAASDTLSEPNQTNTMSKLIFAALAISAVAENAESEALTKITAMHSDMASKASRIAELEAKNAEITASLALVAKTRADDLVKAAVSDGRILPKDEDRQTKFRDKIEAGDTFAEEILAQLPRLNAGLSTPFVRAAGVQPSSAGGFEIMAQALVTAGHASSLDEALAVVAAADPTAYGQYLKEIAPAN